MTIGKEDVLVDELDREEEKAIAAVVRARFGQGNLQDALRTMTGVTTRRLQMRDRQATRRYG